MTTWTVTEVAQATGLSEGSITAFFNGQGISTKGGLNLHQILNFIERPNTRDHKKYNPDHTRELVILLQRAGYETPYTYQEDTTCEK